MLASILSLGNAGHLFVALSFVASIISAYSYWQVYRAKDETQKSSWLSFARILYTVHSVAIVLVVGVLFAIIYTHSYEYHYAWSHSSNNLPVYYMISSFWEGQEGSFLLWAFWHALMGFFIMKKQSDWEAPTMVVFLAVQAFLITMIIGATPFDIKIGSSPFVMLKEVMANAPIFADNPNFIPTEGSGLNPLLQNYWMVIHPPTLFLGFALCTIPFSFCIAGLLIGRWKEWIRPCLKWLLISAGVLGLGIMMGAYWAYETLNFGGYWSWDPVENAVYVPWLIIVAAIHLIINFQRNKSGLRGAAVMVVSSFLLILYSTFLVRSGVLGNSSVHSFTDLGLTWHLGAFILTFLIFSIYILAKNWKHIPVAPKELEMFTTEFWIFLGAVVLLLSAFQVIVPTSFPFFNVVGRTFGLDMNLAPPSDPVIFYSKFQLWIGLGLVTLSSIAHYFWWKRADVKTLASHIAYPVVITLAIVAGMVKWGTMEDGIPLAKDAQYIVLLIGAVFSIVTSIYIIIGLFRQRQLSHFGGATAHMGIAVMLIGIMYSAAYDNVISLNTSGQLYNSEFDDEMNEKNLLLYRNQPEKMGAYSLNYKGPRWTSKDIPGYIPQSWLVTASIPQKPYLMLAKRDIVLSGKTYAKKGDTVQVYDENSYFEIEYKSPGRKFTLFPRVQVNPKMGTVVSPDIAHTPTQDLYTHITSYPDPDLPREWNAETKLLLAVGDTFFVNDFVAILDKVTRETEVVGFDVKEDEIVAKATIKFLAADQVYTAEPKILLNVNGGDPKVSTEVIEELGVKIVFDDIQISKEEGVPAKFGFTTHRSQKDWVLLKAIEKPLINLIWIGTILTCLGFGLAFYRRLKEKGVKYSSKGSANKKSKELA